MSLILVGGGVRSGKSSFAVDLARRRGRRLALIATAEAKDEEMRKRIERHRIERGDDFVTIEEPLDLTTKLQEIADVDVVVIDCLTLWLSNLLVVGSAATEILDRVDALTDAIGRCSFDTVVVTNEVGMGIVPESPLGRLFRDLAGQAHGALARQADQVYFAALGMMLRLRPNPVQVVVFRPDSSPP